MQIIFNPGEALLPKLQVHDNLFIISNVREAGTTRASALKGARGVAVLNRKTR